MDRSALSHDHRLLTEKARNISEQLSRRLISKEPKVLLLLILKKYFVILLFRKRSYYN